MKLSTFQKGLMSALILILLAGSLIYVNRIARADVFSKEEAQHAIYGVWLSKDIKALDLHNFLGDTQRQVYWPFLHSWLLSLFFLVFGATYSVARLLSLVLLLVTLIFMYRIAGRLSEKSGWKIGLLSIILALSSPIVVKYSAQSTLEALGAFIFMLSFYLYIIAEEQRVTLYYVFLAIAVGLSIYTNYLYAFFMVPAFIVVALGKLAPAVYEVFALKLRGEKAALPFLWWAYRKLIFLTVLLIVLASWFFTASFSRKIMLFGQAIFRFSGGETPTGLVNSLLYYPLQIMRQYTFSPWLGLLMFLALFLPIIAFYQTFRPINKLFTFIWTVLILAVLMVPTKAPQFIYIIAPFIYLVFAAALFYGVERFPRYASALMAVVFIPALFSLPAVKDIYFPAQPGGQIKQALEYFHNSIPRTEPVAAAINLQHLNPEVLAFHFADWKAPVAFDTEMSSDQMFDQARYFLSLELEENSPYRSELLDDSIFSWNGFLADKTKQGQLRELSQVRIAGIGVVAKIFEKQAH